MRGWLWLVCCAGMLGAAAAPQPKPEPRIEAVSPMACQAGAACRVTVHGSNLETARAAYVRETDVRAKFIAAEPKSATFEIAVDAGAVAGERRLRLISDAGLSNAVPLHVVADPVATESQAAVLQAPGIVAGSLSEPGETDSFTVNAKAGETFTFEVVSGATGALDPSLALLESTRTWFEAERWQRIAFNDEDLFFPGLSTNARLTHRFEKAGSYRLQVAGFSGQGSPAAVYYLRATPGEAGPRRRHPTARPSWDARGFTRPLGPNWLSQIHARSGQEPKSFEVPAVAMSAETQAEAKLPSILEGRIDKPATLHTARLKVEKAVSLALEIETPEATMPEFNPVVEVFDETGRELVTSVYTKLNNNGLYMMKMIQAKTTFMITAPGDYKIRVRDITTDHGRHDFRYRVLVREQAPHAGRVEFPDDRINLQAGRTQMVTFQVDREEGFADPIVATVEDLPAGVTVAPCAENPIDKPPLPNAGRLERYIARPQSFSLMLAASPDAPLMTDAPVWPRVVIRPVRNGQLAPPILEKAVPMMVVKAR